MSDSKQIVKDFYDDIKKMKSFDGDNFKALTQAVILYRAYSFIEDAIKDERKKENEKFNRIKD